MSTDIAHLALRLEGPLQSWGFESQYSRRNTGLLPTKSAILGMCCAALGIPRGSEDEASLLIQCTQTRLLVVAVPRSLSYGEWKKRLPVRRITDYHTVQNTKTAKGGTKETHLTYRQYVCDGGFVAVLSGERGLIKRLGDALDNPVWGVWLGRKACVPTAPVYAGVYDSEAKGDIGTPRRSALGSLHSPARGRKLRGRHGFAAGSTGMFRITQRYPPLQPAPRQIRRRETECVKLSKKAFGCGLLLVQRPR